VAAELATTVLVLNGGKTIMDRFPRNMVIEDLLRKRNIVEARRTTQKVLRRNPDDVVGQYYLALCEYYDGDKDEAEKVVKKLLKKSDIYAPAHYLLGKILEQKGDQDGAYHAFQAAMDGGVKEAGSKLDQYRTSMKQDGGKPPSSRKVDLKVDTEKRQGLEEALMGIEIPTGLKYSDQHLWIRMDDEVGTVGITDVFRFLQNPQDVWVEELPKVGSIVEFGQIISKITGLVNPEVRKRIYPKGEWMKYWLEERKTFKDGHGYFRDPRKRIWISVPSPVSGQIVNVNKPMIRKGKEHSYFRSRQPLNLYHPYAKFSWLFRIVLNEKGWNDLNQLMDANTYREFIATI